MREVGEEDRPQERQTQRLQEAPRSQAGLGGVGREAATARGSAGQNSTRGSGQFSYEQGCNKLAVGKPSGLGGLGLGSKSTARKGPWRWYCPLSQHSSCCRWGN